MKKLIFFIIPLVFLCVGCRDSKIREVRGQFMEGCKSSGSNADVCSCIFERIEERYSRDQILDMKIGIVPEGFQEYMVKSALQCARDN